MKTRWFNFRPICLVFLFLLLGSLFSFYISINLGFTLSLAVIAFILLFILAFIKKKIKYFIIPFLAFILGFSAYNLRINIFNNSIVDAEPGIIACRVCDLKSNGDRLMVVQADNCKFDGDKTDANIILYVYDNNNQFDNIEVGSLLEVEPTNFYGVDLFERGMPNSNYFQENIKYVVISNVTKIENKGTENTIDELVRNRVKDNLSLALSNENVEVVYSALFGEKSSLSSEQYDIYRASGIAHLLAVSGLHVSVVIAILYGILTMFRVKKNYRILFLLPILLFYAYLCQFTVSVVRAIIMSMVLLLAHIVHKEYDIYNSLSIAGIIIYLINPLCVFDAGFLLSFLTVFGIATLFNVFYRAFKKMKMNDMVANSMAISLSATVTIFGVMMFYFRTINFVSFIANIVILPLFSFAFSICFILSSLSLLIPYIVYLLYPLNHIFSFINILATILGGFSIANMQTQAISFVSIILYFALIFINGRLNMSKFRFKAIISVPILLIICLTFFVM